MIIRNAVETDIDFIVEEGIEFLKYHPSRIDKTYDKDYLYKLALDLITNHVVFIAEKEEKNIGMICGMIIPSLFNPNFIGLQEIFWWVKKEERNTSAAIKLFRAFEKEASALQLDFITMSSTVYTPQLEKIYKKYKYKPVESIYLKEL